MYAPAGPPPYGTPPPVQSGTDGIAIAALVTGVVGLGIVPLVLGIVGLHRVKRSGQDGKGLAIAGIVLGAVEIVVGIVVLAIAIIVAAASSDTTGTGWDSGGQSYGDNATLDRLYDQCDQGDMDACDDLFFQADSGTEYEDFGDTCGGRTSGGALCSGLVPSDGTGRAE